LDLILNTIPSYHDYTKVHPLYAMHYALYIHPLDTMHHTPTVHYTLTIHYTLCTIHSLYTKHSHTSYPDCIADYTQYTPLLSKKKGAKQILLGLHKGIGGAMLADQVKGGRGRIGMSGIGGIAATQAVIDLCAKVGVVETNHSRDESQQRRITVETNHSRDESQQRRITHLHALHTYALHYRAHLHASHWLFLHASNLPL
jgi:hypothetical protein